MARDIAREVIDGYKEAVERNGGQALRLAGKERLEETKPCSLCHFRMRKAHRLQNSKGDDVLVVGLRCFQKYGIGHGFVDAEPSEETIADEVELC